MLPDRTVTSAPVTSLHLRRTALILALTAASLGLAACGKSSDTPTLAAAAPQTCVFTAHSDAGGRAPGLPPTAPPQKTGTATATIVTNMGTVVFTMDAAKTPCTTDSFTWLASKMFFDNTVCHRLTTSGIFVLQCGDPAGDGQGGPGYTIPDENLKDATYPAGSVAMANTGEPHSGGSQFFLNYQASPLPPSYTPFATITQGLDVLRKIAAAGTSDGGADGKPKSPVKIMTFTVTAG